MRRYGGKETVNYKEENRTRHRMDIQKENVSNIYMEKKKSYRGEPKRRQERKGVEEEEKDEVNEYCRRRIQKERTWDRKDKMRAEVKLEDG